jgi:hypothetical protein
VGEQGAIQSTERRRRALHQRLVLGEVVQIQRLGVHPGGAPRPGVPGHRVQALGVAGDEVQRRAPRGQQPHGGLGDGARGAEDEDLLHHETSV